MSLVPDGLLLPTFTDSHVHLGLFDPRALVGGGIGRVLDLGWNPAIAVGWLDSPDLLHVDIAGPLLAAPGGYPITSGWAPAAAVREIADAAGAATAIDEIVSAGSAVAKITLNSEAGPVWDDNLLASVVSLAHARSLPVVAHAQGAGQAERALDGGVDCLAHTPWTENLSDDVIRRMVGAMAWISTLDIHGWGSYGSDFARAIANLERFVAWGGKVHYGTDLGNGALPVGLNRRELEALAGAGLDAAALLASLRGLVPAASGDRTASVVPGALSLHDIRGIDELMHAIVITNPEEVPT
jgi:hypothetical protein